MDQSKKTMRHFYCRDVLWETFEQMANDFDCSIDYLINESMRYYARSKNYPAANAPGAAGASELASSRCAPAAPPARRRRAARSPAPSRPRSRRRRWPASRRPRAARRRRPRRGTSPVAWARWADAPARRRTTARRPAPAAAPAGAGPRAAADDGRARRARRLFLMFNGQRYPVAKDQFIIGRGSKTSDLAIKDGNISRKHAAVIRRNGTFYIKDLGSTNGIDYKGMRIDNKRIDEGDVFHLCDYELRFTYRGE
jgi:hypothetical protein